MQTETFLVQYLDDVYTLAAGRLHAFTNEPHFARPLLINYIVEGGKLN